MSKKVSYIIPCYRSANTIHRVIEEIEETMGDKEDYEIILVNDCSPDNTYDVIKEICKNNTRIIGVNFAKNFGQHAALMAGFRQVTGDVVVCLDDDGQTPANEAYKLLDKIAEGYDVVYAKYLDKQHSLGRNIGSKLNQKMAESLLNKPKDLYISSYFAARKFVVDKMIEYENPYPYVIGLVLRATNNIANVEVKHRMREEGVSGYTLTKLIALWINGFTSFSVKPLRIASYSGMFFAMAGFVYMIYTIIHKIVNPSTPMGWSSIMAALLFLGGVILLVLGMIGEYVGRIYICINNSPQYVIKEIIKYGSKEKDD